MTDLMPCPFCGGEAHMQIGRADDGGKKFQVGCHDADCAGSVLEATVFYYEEDAVAAWNRRSERTCRPINVDRWDEDGRLHKLFHRCSECGHELPYEAEKGHCGYCPHCGAKVVS